MTTRRSKRNRTLEDEDPSKKTDDPSKNNGAPTPSPNPVARPVPILRPRTDTPIEPPPVTPAKENKKFHMVNIQRRNVEAPKPVEMLEEQLVD
jgi:hypothetical protein